MNVALVSEIGAARLNCSSLAPASGLFLSLITELVDPASRGLVSSTRCVESNVLFNYAAGGPEGLVEKVASSCERGKWQTRDFLYLLRTHYHYTTQPVGGRIINSNTVQRSLTSTTTEKPCI